MKAEEVVFRARSVVSLGCAYKLGKGGMNPKTSVPWDSLGFCDCSGAVSWFIGVSRQTDNPWYKNQNGGWFETSAIVADCKTSFGFFEKREWGQTAPGMLLVWGDRKVSGKTRQGHVGVVTDTRAGEPYTVVHCSSGNFRNHGDAILETDVSIFKANGAIVARCAFVN